MSGGDGYGDGFGRPSGNGFGFGNGNGFGYGYGRPSGNGYGNHITPAVTIVTSSGATLESTLVFMLTSGGYV